GFVGVSLLIAGLYLDRALEEFAVESLAARLASAGGVLTEETRGLLRESAGPVRMQAFATRVARATQARVTVIAPDGRVVAESERDADDLPRLENHAGRPEVRAALQGRVGRDLRQSATLDAPLLYAAQPVTDAGRVIGALR